MKYSYFISGIAAAAVSAALLIGQTPQTAEEKAKAKAELKAKQIANNFENNATVLTFYDRSGKAVGTAGERALYGGVVLSPDRTRAAVVKVDQAAENADLYILDLNSGGTLRMTNGGSREFVQGAVWSPDGSQIAYVAIRGSQEAVYRRNSKADGPEELIYKNPGLGLGLSDWSLDGRYLAFAKSDLTGGVLYVLPLAGQGEREPIEVFRSPRAMNLPRFSPDGRFLSYVMANEARTQAEAYVRPLNLPGAAARSDGPWQITEGGIGGAPSWRRDGKELYYIAPDRSVMVAEVATAPSFAFQKPRVLFRPPGAVPVPIVYVSSDGERFVALPPPRGPRLQQLTIFDREGKVVSKVGSPGLLGGPSFSPDGTRLAVLVNDLATAKNDIWLFDIATGKSTPFKSELPPGNPLLWSKDGKRIYYGATRGTYSGIYRRNSDGTGNEELVFRYTAGAGLQLTDVSPDEKFVVFNSGGVLLTAVLSGSDPLTRQAVEVSREEFETDSGRLSPDARFLAFRSNETERNEIYIRRFDAAKGTAPDGEKWQVSKDGVQGMLHWRGDGKEIFFRDFRVGGAQELWVVAVEVNTEPPFKAGEPKVLFKLPGPQGGNLGNVSPDGQRFVFAVNVPAGQ